MVNESHKQLESLAKFPLSFEYNETWTQAKRAVKARTTAE